MAKKLTEKNVLLLTAMLALVQENKGLHKAVVEACGQELLDKVSSFAEQGNELDNKYDNDPYGYVDLIVVTIKSIVK